MTDAKPLEGRTVLVTGAAGGIGSATARTLVADGAKVILHDISAEPLKALSVELGSASTPIPADLSDAPATQGLWDEANAAYGQVDVLVNNAGIFQPVDVDAHLDEWVDVWDRALKINLLAPSILCRAAVRSFSERSAGGVIVNIASVAAFRGALPDYWHYGAAKAGMVSLTRTIARSYGRRGVTAFAVAPGFVETPMSKETLNAAGIQGVTDQAALGSVAQPQDVANVIAFLATGKARHATGTTIDVNSGSYFH